VPPPVIRQKPKKGAWFPTAAGRSQFGQNRGSNPKVDGDGAVAFEQRGRPFRYGAGVEAANPK
jgi:hypothetical protein